MEHELIFDILFMPDNLDGKIHFCQFFFGLENTTKTSFAKAHYGLKFWSKPAKQKK